MEEIKVLKSLIQKANYIVFLGGAGVSTASGIPDFRGEDGLYGETYKKISPEEILSRDFFLTRTKDFYDYYKKNMLFPSAQPNGAHISLARLEKTKKLKAVITQNIDGLHQKAGSENVIELHGSVLRNRCLRCGAFYTVEDMLAKKGVPCCDKCGGVIKPDVVLYGENLDEDAITQAVRHVLEADLLIVGGTSLTVNPAASFVRFFRGDNLVIINKSPTPYDGFASLIIRESIDKVLSAAIE